jgi:hypothetical protein
VLIEFSCSIGWFIALLAGCGDWNWFRNVDRSVDKGWDRVRVKWEMGSQGCLGVDFGLRYDRTSE